MFALWGCNGGVAEQGGIDAGRPCVQATEDGSVDTCDNVPTDNCTSDPNKTQPGMCGCGVPDSDQDRDGTADCQDLCASDPLKTAPGDCGCGQPEGLCSVDDCPSDPDKTQPGICGCGQPEPSPSTPDTCVGTDDAAIDGVYFAQNHVLAPDDPNFKLVSERDALIKVHVVSKTAGMAPEVSATLSRNGQTLKLVLSGPSTLPTSIPSGPGVVQHRYEDSFTTFIPAAWVKPGLSVVVHAGEATLNVGDLKIGAPTRVIMTMFDIHYFKSTPGDYPAGWKAELEAKWPVSAIELRRTPNVVFPQLVIPPRADLPATRVSSAQDYKDQTGTNFDGEQAAALQWSAALKAAAGSAGRVSLYYLNIYGASAGGQAGGFGGVGNGTSQGILNHELGHALSLPHWGDNAQYPYKGDMYGIKAPSIYNLTHAGPTWAFDLLHDRFLPPTVQADAVGGVPATYKADPMQGGGTGDQEKEYIFRHFSDYSMTKMRNYLESHVVVWNASLNSYASWNDAAGSYTTVVSNDGVQYALQRNVSVISVMAAVSAATAKATMVYPPIGPYVAGQITLFDPRVLADRTSADSLYCPVGGCDVSLRIVQGGKQKIYMLPIVWDAASDPLSTASLSTRALNLPAKDGTVTSIDLLSSPDAEKVGLPASPPVLSTWTL